MTKILMIDDDAGLANPLRTYFARYDLELDHSEEPFSGIERVSNGDYSLLILDIMLPGIDGFEVCRKIRQFSDLPIIMLTARGEVTDRIVGLELGADDYLAKPFEPRELVARIQRILKRSNGTRNNQNEAQAVIDAGNGIEIDRQQQRVTISGRALELTTREFALLELFSDSPGQVWTRDQIMNELRGTDADLYSRVIDISVSRLRKKLLPLEPIKTVWGKGYQWIR